MAALELMISTGHEDAVLAVAANRKHAKALAAGTSPTAFSHLVMDLLWARTKGEVVDELVVDHPRRRRTDGGGR